MAANATLSKALLFLAGPWEFLDPNADKAPPDNNARILAAAFDKLGYDRGYATAEERQWLVDRGQALPRSFRVVDKKPVTEEREVGGHTVGLVYLPRDPAHADAAIRAARELRPRVDLVVAVSPWGYRPESSALGDLAGAVDILLGGGPGKGVRGEVAENGRIFWGRSYTKGKGVLTVQLTQWPGKGTAWVLDQNIVSDIVPLDDDVLDDDIVFETIYNAALSKDGRDQPTEAK